MRCHRESQQTVLCDLFVVVRPRWENYRDRALEVIRAAIK